MGLCDEKRRKKLGEGGIEVIRNKKKSKGCVMLE